MSKQKSIAKVTKTTDMSRADYELTRMKYNDLKRACIARGMPFEEASGGSVLQLASWFKKHYDNGQDLKLLDEFDKQLDELLRSRGYVKGDAVFHNSLKMSLIVNIDEEGNESKKKPRLGNKGLDKKKKPKRERIEGTKIFAGTKKALTYQCQKEKKSLKDTWVIVSKAFPEAQEKSVKIWYKRSEKGK